MFGDSNTFVCVSGHIRLSVRGVQWPVYNCDSPKNTEHWLLGKVHLQIKRKTLRVVESSFLKHRAGDRMQVKYNKGIDCKQAAGL